MGAIKNLQDANAVYQALINAEYYYNNTELKRQKQEELDIMEERINAESQDLWRKNENKIRDRNTKIAPILSVILYSLIVLAITAWLTWLLYDKLEIFYSFNESIANKPDLIGETKNFQDNLNYMKWILLIALPIWIICVSTFIICLIISLKKDDDLESPPFSIACFTISYPLALSFLALIFMFIVMIVYLVGYPTKFFLDTDIALEAYSIYKSNLTPIFTTSIIMFFVPIGYAIILFTLCNEKFIHKILNLFTINRAKRKDKVYLKKHKSEILSNNRAYCDKLKEYIAEIDKNNPESTILQAKNIIEELSPIYCQGFEVNENNKIEVNINEILSVKIKIKNCIDTIKSGRAQDITQALNVIEHDNQMQKIIQTQYERNAIEYQKVSIARSSLQAQTEHYQNMEKELSKLRESVVEGFDNINNILL